MLMDLEINSQLNIRILIYMRVCWRKNEEYYNLQRAKGTLSLDIFL